MVDKSKGASVGDVETLAQAVDGAARAFAASAENIEEAADIVERSCNTPGTRAMAHHDALLGKVEELNTLAAFYASVAKRLRAAGVKLERGAPLESIVNEVQTYGTFVGDQLQREETEAQRVLRMLRNGGPDDRSPIAAT